MEEHPNPTLQLHDHDGFNSGKLPLQTGAGERDDSEGVRIAILDSPYRLFIEPLLAYIREIAQRRQPGETITIVVPKFVSNNPVRGVLHTNTADLLRAQLMNQKGIIVTSVPYHVDEKDDRS